MKYQTTFKYPKLLLTIYTIFYFQIVKGDDSFCPFDRFRCSHYINDCRPRTDYCDGTIDCSNRYDELFCDGPDTKLKGGCFINWWACNDGRCIPEHWRCNTFVDCDDRSDEFNCGETKADGVLPLDEEYTFSGGSVSHKNLVKWFMGRRKNGTTTNKWGHELPRTAVALFLADKSFFSPGRRIMEEMSYELSIQLLSYLAGDGEANKNDLASYIHALMVTCIDPRNFHGRDLVSELRSKVEGSGNTTNPFEILVLCNAGDKMSKKDLERVLLAYSNRNRPFYIDNQAMASIALACISSRTDVSIDERTLIDMEQELKKRQFSNGTVANLKTTALVIQALIANNSSYNIDFNLEAAVEVILQSQNADGSIGSFLDSYYILPALSNSSLIDINSEHCKRPTPNEEEALSEFQKTRGERLSTQYSIWIGSDMDLKNTWTLKVPYNSSYYDILEIANRLDSRQRVKYNVVDGKPYVSSLMGLHEDIEKGRYWFTYVGVQNSDKNPKLVKESPADMKIGPNQEIILWYKSG